MVEDMINRSDSPGGGKVPVSSVSVQLGEMGGAMAIYQGEFPSRPSLTARRMVPTVFRLCFRGWDASRMVKVCRRRGGQVRYLTYQAIYLLTQEQDSALHGTRSGL